MISPGLGGTTFVIFCKDCPYLLVLPVTIASASEQATIQEPQITLSFLTNLSQSLLSKPCDLCNFSNKCFEYFSLNFFLVEFIISISKFSP